jgi:hypothetical protein
MREFVTAAEKSEEPDTGEEPVVFLVDGHEMRAYKPTEGQFALLMMAMGRHASTNDQFAGVVDFFFNVLDEPSQMYFSSRMMSREDLIPLEKIVEIMEFLTEEWGGRPFQRPSASTSSRRSGGRKSTARTPALT